MNISITTLGLARLVGGLRIMHENAPKQVDNVLQTAAEQVFERSQTYVPVATGYLKSTGYVRETSKHEWTVGYDADYAIYVHERYAQHAAPTTWKFLELAYLELDASIDDSVAALDLTKGLNFRIS